MLGFNTLRSRAIGHSLSSFPTHPPLPPRICPYSKPWEPPTSVARQSYVNFSKALLQMTHRPWTCRQPKSSPSTTSWRIALRCAPSVQRGSLTRKRGSLNSTQKTPPACSSAESGSWTWKATSYPRSRLQSLTRGGSRNRRLRAWWLGYKRKRFIALQTRNVERRDSMQQPGSYWHCSSKSGLSWKYRHQTNRREFRN